MGTAGEEERQQIEEGRSLFSGFSPSSAAPPVPTATEA